MSRITIETSMSEFIKPSVTEEYMMAICADYRIVPIDKMAIGDDRNVSDEDTGILPVTLQTQLMRHR